MYSKYNIPQIPKNMQSANNFNMPSTYSTNMQYTGKQYGSYPNNGDRFIGGGFLGPFILGGIAGSLVTRPGGFGPPPPPIIYYPPVPAPYYSSNNYYY